MPTAGCLYPQLTYQGDASSPGSPWEENSCISKITSLYLRRRTLFEVQLEPFSSSFWILCTSWLPPLCQALCQSLEIWRPWDPAVAAPGPTAEGESCKQKSPKSQHFTWPSRVEQLREVESTVNNFLDKNWISLTLY